MPATARRLGVSSLLLGLASCSFFTDFPAIEGVGGAGTTSSNSSASSSSGGNECLTDCTDAFGGAYEPPLLGERFALHAESGQSARAIWITDGVQTVPPQGSGGNGEGTPETWWIATYAPGDASMEKPNVAETTGQHGLLLGPGGEVLRKMRLCTGGESTSDQETFANGISALRNGRVVVAGGFEDALLSNTSEDGGCNGSPTRWDSDDPTNAVPGTATPFLTWFFPQGTLAQTLTSGSLPTTGTSYFSDVAAGRDETDEVFAVGVGHGNLFGLGLSGGRAQYFLLRSTGPGASWGAAIDRHICADDQSEELHGLRSSIAVDEDGAIWVGGTGCSAAEDLPASRSFLYRYDGFVSAVPDPIKHPFDLGPGDLSITRIAVTPDHVIVAGSYSGTPIPQTEGSDIDAGDEYDGFLMVFARAGEWGDQRKPIWFQRLSSSDPVRIQSLTAEGGRIFLGGTVKGSADFAGAAWCYASSPDRERAFFAQFNEENGQLDWARVLGFAPSGGDAGTPAVYGTATVPENGGLAVAYTTVGESLIECADGGATEAPVRAHTATLSFQVE